MRGNKGRVAGVKNRATIAAQKLLDGEAEALTRKAIELAKMGDIRALRLCFARLVPPRRHAPIQMELPRVETSADATLASREIVQSFARGDLTPDEAEVALKLILSLAGVLEIAELESRVAVLESHREPDL